MKERFKVFRDPGDLVELEEVEYDPFVEGFAITDTVEGGGSKDNSDEECFVSKD